MLKSIHISQDSTIRVGVFTDTNPRLQVSACTDVSKRAKRNYKPYTTKKTMGTHVSILEAILVSAVSLIGLLVFMRVVETIKSKKQ